MAVDRWRQAGSPGVTLYTVTGGGHTIPNPTRRAVRLLGRTTRDIDAGAVVGQLIDGTEPPGAEPPTDSTGDR